MTRALGSIPTAEGAVSATIASMGCCWLRASAQTVVNLQHIQVYVGLLDTICMQVYINVQL